MTEPDEAARRRWDEALSGGEEWSAPRRRRRRATSTQPLTVAEPRASWSRRRGGADAMPGVSGTRAVVVGVLGLLAESGGLAVALASDSHYLAIGLIVAGLIASTLSARATVGLVGMFAGVAALIVALAAANEFGQMPNQIRHLRRHAGF